MARKTKTTKSRTRQPRPQPVPSGPRTTEDLDDTTLQALAFNHKRKLDAAQAAAKLAGDNVKSAKKIAIAEMGADALEVLKDLQDLETEKGEIKLTTAVKRILRSARWAGSPLGQQFEFFDGPDRTPSVDRAHEAGKRAGMNGEPAKPPHDPSTEQYARWMAGWQEGQEAHARAGFKSMDPPQGSRAKDDDGGEQTSGERVSRSEFKEKLAGMTGTPKIGDQPSTARVEH